MCLSERQLSRRAVLGGAALGGLGLLTGCGTPRQTAAEPAGSAAPTSGPPTPQSPTTTASPASPTDAAGTASAAEIVAKTPVPVLCYHQVRPYEAGDTSYNQQLLIAEPAKFHEQLDAIKQAGYTTISPDQYLGYLTTGAQLPAKPVMLSFDDGKDNQPEVALPALVERGMTGTWFIMTVVVGNPGWTTKSQIKEMADAGVTIGCHTWDHHDVRTYAGKDFTTQFDEPRKKLQDLSGQKVDSFAYPYGAWNTAALPHLEKAGFSTAFQLDEKPLDPRRPLMTLRRSLTVSDWTGDQVIKELEKLARPI